MLLQQLRIDSFATKVQERNGPSSATIIKLMMSSSMLHGRSMEVGTTEPMSLNQIAAMLHQGSTVDQAKLQAMLETLSADTLKSIKRVNQADGDTKYSVNLASILYYIQLKIIEGLIERKFGDKAYIRVFRALQALGCANEK